MERAPRGIDPSKAHPARRYNYWLGGKDNFKADRESGEAVAKGFPTIRLAALENRAFLGRVVRHLAEDLGIRQFLDIGAGLPSAGNVHEIAQAIAPGTRVVYVDNDPIVLVHSQALLRSSAEGATAYVDADLRDPEKILDHEEVRLTLNLDEPVALMLVAVVHFLPDDAQVRSIIARLTARLAPGSYVVVTNATHDYLPAEESARVVAADRTSGIPFRVRSAAEVAALLDGLELLPPGVGSVVNWHPTIDPDLRPSIEDVAMHCAVARVP